VPAYIIANIEIADAERYAQYARLTPAAIEKYGGRFVVRGGPVVTLEGPEEKRRIVVLEFPSVAQARTFYDSPEYRHAKSFRDGAATASFILVEGFAPAPAP